MGEATLRAKFGRAGSHYHQLAHGIDPRRVKRQVESNRSAKSIGSDRTLSEDVVQRADIERHLRRSSHRIAVRVREKRFMAGGVRVRLKTSRFQMLTRRMLLAQPADTAESFLAAARTLLDHFDLQRDGPFRLVGMAVFDLRSQQDDSPAQAELFQPQPSRNLETTIDDLAARFGPEVVMRARDLLNPGTVSRNGVNLDFLDEDNNAQA